MSWMDAGFPFALKKGRDGGLRYSVLTNRYLSATTVAPGVEES